MDYKEFYRISEKVTKTFPNEEIAYRTAISRAYYFVFHHVRENKKKNKYRVHFTQGTGDHGKVKELLKKVDVNLSALFTQLHDRRKIADYDMEKNIGQQEWQNHLKEVEVLIEKLDDIGFIKRK